MNEQVKTIVQTLHFILSRIGQADKKKLIKLLFLADKHHLQLYGKTITNDNYRAMKHGPVGSIALDILNFNMEWLEQEQIDYAENFIDGIDDLNRRAKSHCQYEMLSELDEKSLGFIIDRFGKLNSDALEAITHKYPEWSIHEKDILSGAKDCVEINTEELFSTIKEYPPNISEEHIKNSQDIYCGYF